jgi:hypothetical protein
VLIPTLPSSPPLPLWPRFASRIGACAAAAIFFERGIAVAATQEFSSLSTEAHAPSQFVASVFEIDGLDLAAFVEVTTYHPPLHSAVARIVFVVMNLSCFALCTNSHRVDNCTPAVYCSSLRAAAKPVGTDK